MDLNSKEIKKIHDQIGCSLQKAHKIVIKQNIINEAEKAKTIEELKSVLIQTINIVL